MAEAARGGLGFRNPLIAVQNQYKMKLKSCGNLMVFSEHFYCFLDISLRNDLQKKKGNTFMQQAFSCAHRHEARTAFFSECALPRVTRERLAATSMVDYSKWDNLQVSDDEDDAPALHKPALPSSGGATAVHQV
jgi:hypothetical protein